MGETHSSFGLYYRWQAFLVTSPYRCKRTKFLSRNALLDFYFKIILPSVLYGLVIWGGCPNADFLHSLEVLHRWAARIMNNLPRDMLTEEVYRHSNWNTLTLYYKLRLIKLLHSVFLGEAPAALSYLTNKPCTAYNFRRSSNKIVLRFNSQCLKNSVSYRGAILWNAVSTNFTEQFTVFFIAKWRRTLILRNLILAHSRSSRYPGTTKILKVLNYFMF